MHNPLMLRYIRHLAVGVEVLGAATVPVIEHSRRRVGVSPLYWFIMPLEAATGTGMVSVIGLWNFLLRGSTVTIGETATRLPSSLAVSSVGIGWAWQRKQNN